MVWLYLTDACLSCPGLVIAGSALQRRGVILLALPLIGMLSLFARERTQRLDGRAPRAGPGAAPDDDRRAERTERELAHE
jgi:hypothetical protein